MTTAHDDSLSDAVQPDDPAGGDWAICCSGGGIRSAAYCLGALQALQEGGLLAKAKWILGVSGGSYISASRALVAHHLPEGATPAAYAPGSPEERNLRNNTRYLAPDGSVILVGMLSLFLGVLVTFVLIAAPLYAFSHAWGWLLRWQGVLIPSGRHSMTVSVSATSWWLAPAIAGGLMVVLFAWWWATLGPVDYRRRTPPPWYVWLKPDDRDSAANRAELVGWAALLTAGLALAMLAAPALISWLYHSSGPVGTIARFAGFGQRPTWSVASLAAVIAAITTVARSAQTGLAKWNSTATTKRASGGKSGPGSAPAQPGLFATLVAGVRQRLLPWLGSAIVVLIGALLVLLWMAGGARAGYSASQLTPVLVALVVVLATRLAANVNRLSMHDFYRWRLADAYAITRTAAEALNPLRARQLFSDAAAFRMSSLKGEDGAPDEPELVICATANINAAREVPPGQAGFSVAFDSQFVTLHREAGIAAPERAQALTSDYEALIGHRQSTLFDISAISGAAISPLMGSMTRHAYRILLTATNVRLGVWLPHPTVIRKARELIDEQTAQARQAAASADGEAVRRADGTAVPRADGEAAPPGDRPWAHRPLLLLLWYLTPHPMWNRHEARNSAREARLWAHVLRLRLRRGLAGAVWYRVMQPTLGLLWAEAVGRLSYRSTWMYVTDGGHYDNLGLVEALRRGARNIVVLDASGDKANSWFTLGGTIALARADEGVEIELEPMDMVSGAKKLAFGQVVRPWTHGTFTRTGGDPRLPRQGQIWVCKLGWWEDAPWDVLAYAKGHHTYPCDSTLEQLFDSAEFEAYHQLGQASVLAAADKCAPPLRWTAPEAAPTSAPAEVPAEVPPQMQRTPAASPAAASPAPASPAETHDHGSSGVL